jgi:Fe-S cluster assembly ATP-binding protein
MNKVPLLEIKGLHAEVEGREILKGIDLVINPGEVHALMGRNGSGKSTLANTLMGHPKYKATAGKVLLNGEDVLKMPVDERARKGMFLVFQYPLEITGVSMANFMRTAVKMQKKAAFVPAEFRKDMTAAMSRLEMDPSFATRYINEGFSGGEKKRAEVFQMTLLKPRLAVLDEADSGLDIDALKTVSAGVNALLGPEFSALVITHYQRLLDYIKPDRVHVLEDGAIVRSGGRELALKLEAKGYEQIIEEKKD